MMLELDFFNEDILNDELLDESQLNYFNNLPIKKIKPIDKEKINNTINKGKNIFIKQKAIAVLKDIEQRYALFCLNIRSDMSFGEALEQIESIRNQLMFEPDTLKHSEEEYEQFILIALTFIRNQ